MTKCTVTLHPKGLDPFQAVKAWLLRKKLKQLWRDVRKQVRTVSGNLPHGQWGNVFHVWGNLMKGDNLVNVFRVVISLLPYQPRSYHNTLYPLHPL